MLQRVEEIDGEEGSADKYEVLDVWTKSYHL